jgi:hypothetical protein
MRLPEPSPNLIRQKTGAIPPSLLFSTALHTPILTSWTAVVPDTQFQVFCGKFRKVSDSVRERAEFQNISAFCRFISAQKRQPKPYPPQKTGSGT